MRGRGRRSADLLCSAVDIGYAEGGARVFFPAKFMQFVNANIAKEAGRLHLWRARGRCLSFLSLQDHGISVRYFP
jgi:hypothetical protein